jgi:predicted MFS family arabinose efflux permease
VMSGSAVGALAGGAIALRYRPSRPLVTCWAVTLSSGFQLLLLIPPAPAIVMALAAVVAMIGVSISISVWTTTVQEQVPERALSRVSAYDWLGSLVAMPLGYALAGPASETIGVDATLAVGAGLMVGAAAGALAVPSVRSVRRADLDGAVASASAVGS